jgi:hypothetical protein
MNGVGVLILKTLPALESNETPGAEMKIEMVSPNEARDSSRRVMLQVIQLCIITTKLPSCDLASL